MTKAQRISTNKEINEPVQKSRSRMPNTSAVDKELLEEEIELNIEEFQLLYFIHYILILLFDP